MDNEEEVDLPVNHDLPNNLERQRNNPPLPVGNALFFITQHLNFVNIFIKYLSLPIYAYYVTLTD
jgi:hypothetical protein